MLYLSTEPDNELGLHVNRLDSWERRVIGLGGGMVLLEMSSGLETLFSTGT